MRKINSTENSLALVEEKLIQGSTANTARDANTLVLPVQPVDETGTIIKGGGSSISAQYLSPIDFRATYTSPTTITISNLSFNLGSSVNIVYIKVANGATNITRTYVNGSAGYSFSHSSGVITVYLNGVAAQVFNSADSYEVGINALPFEKDPSTQSIKTSSLTNVWNQYTDPETLVTAQNLTNIYADFGPEIDMRGFNRLGVYIITDVNDSLNVSLKVLGKHTGSGIDEYDIDGVGVKTLWATVVSDSKIYYEFDVGTIPFIQLQAVAGTVGAIPGDLTITIDKKWRN
jgi:hypothetical protein